MVVAVRTEQERRLNGRPQTSEYGSALETSTVVRQLHKTTRNLANVVGGEMLLRIANLGVAVLIGRVYGVSVLGTYATVLAIATLAERVADNGLEMTAIVEVSRNPALLARTAAALRFDKIILSAAAMCLLAILAWRLGLSRGEWAISAVLTLRTFLYSFCRLNAGMLKALDKTKQIARIQAVHCAFLVLCLSSVSLLRQSLLVLLVCLLLAQAVEYVLSSITLRTLGARSSPISFSLCWGLVRRSTPIGLTYTLSTLMLRGDVLILSLIASATVVGAFAAANTGLIMIYVVAWLFGGVLLSDLGSLLRNHQAFDSHFRQCLRAIVLISVPITTVGILFARITIVELFGKNFAVAGVPGALMMISLPFIFLNAAFLSRLIARSRARIAMAVYGCTAILSLLLNYFLGRWYGAAGVACSIAIREALMVLAFLYFWKLPSQPEQVVAIGNPKLATLWNT
jgi:O-antigen/teichoic acid export membrane protein